jgi:hypothetical protein
MVGRPPLLGGLRRGRERDVWGGLSEPLYLGMCQTRSCLLVSPRFSFSPFSLISPALTRIFQPRAAPPSLGERGPRCHDVFAGHSSPLVGRDGGAIRWRCEHGRIGVSHRPFLPRLCDAIWMGRAGDMGTNGTQAARTRPPPRRCEIGVSALGSIGAGEARSEWRCAGGVDAWCAHGQRCGMTVSL